MRIMILDSHNRPVGFLDNEFADIGGFTDDVLETFLAGSAATLNLTAFVNGEMADRLDAGNHLAFRKDHKDYYFTIEKSTRTADTVSVEALGISLELANEQVPAYKGTSQSFEDYMNAMRLKTGDIRVGINEVADKRISTEWTSEASALTRFFELADAFSAEIEFCPQLARDYSLDALVLNIYRAHDDSRQGMGHDRRHEVITYKNGMQSMERTADLSDFFSAVRPLGTENDKNQPLTLGGYPEQKVMDQYGNLMYHKPAGSEYIYAVRSRDLYPASLKDDGYVTADWSYDTKDQNELYGHGLGWLKKNCLPKTSYKFTGFLKGDIGDTITIRDDTYKPALFLECRIVGQKISDCNPSGNETTLDNFTVVSPKLSDITLKNIQRMINASKRYQGLIVSSAGTLLRDGGSTVLSARIMDGEKEIAEDVTWYKDGKEAGTGKSITVKTSDLESPSAVYSFRADRCQAEVTVSKIFDGKSGLTMNILTSAGSSFHNSEGSTDLKVSFVYADRIISSMADLEKALDMTGLSLKWDGPNVSRVKQDGFVLSVNAQDFKGSGHYTCILSDGMKNIAAAEATINDLTDGYSVFLSTDARSLQADSSGRLVKASFDIQVNVLQGNRVQVCTVDPTAVKAPEGIRITCDDAIPSPSLHVEVNGAVSEGFTLKIPVVFDGLKVEKVFSASAAIAGKNAPVLKSRTRQYQLGPSGTTAPAGTWLDSIPQPVSGMYLWTKTTEVFTDDSKAENLTCAYIPKDGSRGRSVVSVIPEYYLSDSSEKQTGGTWSEELPAFDSSRFLWTRQAVTYKDPVGTEYSSPMLDPTWTKTGEAVSAAGQAESSAADAKKAADSASQTASDISAQIKPIQAGIAKAQKAADDAAASIADSEKTTLEKVAATYAAKSDVADVTGKLQQQVSANAAGLESKVSQSDLETVNKKTQDSIDGLSSQLSDQQKSLTKLQSDQAAAQKTLAAASADLTKAKSDLADLQKSGTATQAQITAAQKAIQNAQSAADAAQKGVNAANAAIAAADKNIKTAQDGLAGLTKRVSTAETNITQNSKEIALKADKTDISDLNARVSKNTSDISLLPAQIMSDVASSYITTEGATTLVDNVSSQITENSSSITAQLKETLTKQINDMASKVDGFNEYLTLDKTGLWLGKTSSQVQLLEENNQVSFVKNRDTANPMMSLSTGGLIIKSITVHDSMTFDPLTFTNLGGGNWEIS